MPMPRFYSSVAPQYRPRGAVGVAAQARAGVGQAVEQAGGAVQGWAAQREYRSDVLAASRAFRDLETWQFDYLRQLRDRRKDLAATTVDPVSGASRTGYETETSAWPERMRGQYQKVRAGLSRRAQEILESRYNSYAPNWSGQAVDVLDRMELEDVTAEIQDLAGQDRASDALELLTLYGDRYSPGDRQRIEAAIGKASTEARVGAVQKYLQGVAKGSSWQVAGTLLNDPEFQQTWGLDLAEAGGIKTDLDKFVREQASLEENGRRALLEANNDAVLADAWEGKLDLTKLPGLVRANQLDAAVAEQARRIMTAPAAENDPETFIAAEQKLREVRSGTLAEAEAVQWFRANAGKLTKETWQQDIKDLVRTKDPADPLGRPIVVLLDKLIDEHYEVQKTFGDYGTPAAERKYLDAKLRFRAAVRDPKLTDEQIRAKYEEIVLPAAKVTFWRSLWSAVQHVGETTEWGYTPPPLGPEPVLGGAFAPPGPTTPAEFSRTDAEREPRTGQEFRDTVKTLPAGSKAQEDYYNRWVGKWR